jgi:hypothetical protein
MPSTPSSRRAVSKSSGSLNTEVTLPGIILRHGSQGLIGEATRAPRLVKEIAVGGGAWLSKFGISVGVRVRSYVTPASRGVVCRQRVLTHVGPTLNLFEGATCFRCSRWSSPMSPLGQSEKIRHRHDAAGLPSIAVMFADSQHRRSVPPEELWGGR